jgi:hypothetical protein
VPMEEEEEVTIIGKLDAFQCLVVSHETNEI